MIKETDRPDLISPRVVAMDRSTVSKDMPSYRFFYFFILNLNF
jgi:hypothetical protein